MAAKAESHDDKPHTLGEFAWNVTVVAGALAVFALGAEVIFD